MEGTDSLRSLAPKWSLAGDNQLLDLLQKSHQKIVEKCQEVNTKLDEMASCLDEASINLQNTNNKFMALSNSQFIESRVYDDDDDSVLTTETQPAKEPPRPAIDELSMLKSTLSILERAHETAEILDDSESDSDAEISVVLKPKDMYAHRPLPYIIGSQQWKNKWHAGLIVEDSDTDSSASKRDGDSDQYSESESEEITRPPLEENTLSESSSSLPGSVGGAGPGAAPPAPVPAAARPADLAAALARRLGAPQGVVLEVPVDYPPPVPAPSKVVRKTYQPEQPASSRIFSDEPPPLEREDESQSSDEDIFAEINKHTPYTQRSTAQSNVTEDLFSFDKPVVDQGDIFSDFAPGNVETKPSVKPKSTLFEDESEPELFEPPKKEITQDHAVDNDETSVSSKKPVGGISLFGSNKGTESIGAAILKRNQRKSSASDEDDDTDSSKNLTDNVKKPTMHNKPKVMPRNNEITEPINKTADETDNKSIARKEKDIFEDLFSKSEKVQQKHTQNIAKQAVKVNVANAKSKTNEKDKKIAKDLFSDNIFDDIDDIFSTNVKIPNKETNKKSLFDDDDLFSDIDVAKTSKSVKKSEPTTKDTKTSVKSNETIVKEKKSIFDSDDELFNDIKKPTERPVSKTESHVVKQTEKLKDTQLSINNDNVNKIESIKMPTENTKERNLFDDSPQIVKSDPKPQIKTKSIFDSDSDDDIFAKIKTPASQKPSVTENAGNLNTIDDNKPIEKEDSAKLETNKKHLTADYLISKEKSLIQSPSLFEEDEIDDLFIAANKRNSQSNEIENTGENNDKVSYESDVLSKLKDTDNVNKSVPKPVKAKESEQNLFQDKSRIDNMVHDNLFEDESDPVSPSINIPKDEPSESNTEVIESSQDITEPVSIISAKPDTKTLPESQLENANNIESNEINVVSQPEENLNQSIFDDFVEPVKEITAAKKSTNAIFDDIFSEPPVFEKPAEPKKSKNINALFDDDSDDESLFFKKDDVISDEKPETFSNNANFGIFVNEPPAIDVDFISKPIENNEIVENEDNLFSTMSKAETIIQPTDAIKGEKNIFSPVTEQVRKVSQYIENIANDNEDELFSSVAKKENVPEADNNKNLSHPVPEIQGKVPEKFFNENKKEENISNSKAQSDIFGSNESKGILVPEGKQDISSADKTNIQSRNIDSDEELFASLPNLPKHSQKNEDVKSNVDKTDEFDDIFKSKESPKKESEVKKIGKINTKNFNINVNALMPGASPKKVQKEIQKEEKSTEESSKMVKIIPDETDFQYNTSMSDNIEKICVQTESKTKSIAFDEKPEAGVLDNNASKQRARIQVKRRPSSRKARHEAARRSAIDFGDETDNSSSFDEPKPKNVIKSDTQVKKRNNDLRNDVKESINPLPKDISNNENMPNKEETVTQKQIVSETVNSKIFRNIDSNVAHPEENVNKIDPPNSKTITESSHESTDNTNENKQTTTKIVYILNDEDIFNTQPTEKTTKSKTIEKTTSDDDIFKTSQGIETLGKTYNENREKSVGASKKEDLPTNIIKDKLSEEKVTEKEMKVNKNKPSLFDDSDDELFSKKKNLNTKKTTIFDSDSEEDLFGGKKSKEKINKEQKNKEVKEKKEVIVKRSLFSDDDDDDLFGVKPKKTEPKPAPSTSKEPKTTSSKSSESVFSDPLSMLGNDD